MRRNLIFYIGIVSPIIVILNDLVGSRENSTKIMFTVLGLFIVQLILAWPLIKRKLGGE